MLQELINSFLPTFTSEESNTLIGYLPAMKQVNLTKGDNIYHKNQEVHSLFLLSSGLVRVYDNLEHQEINLRFLCDYSIILPFYDVAQIWQYGNSQTYTIATETAQCLTACTGYKLPLTALDKLNRSPAASSIVKGKHLGEILRLELALRHYRSMEERLKMLQLKSASQRYHIFMTTMPKQITTHIPSFHIASYLGMSPETLSRIRSQYILNPIP